jgi:hypothetical protein
VSDANRPIGSKAGSSNEQSRGSIGSAGSRCAYRAPRRHPPRVPYPGLLAHLLAYAQPVIRLVRYSKAHTSADVSADSLTTA